MSTEKFNKYEYQNLICEHELSGLEMRILIRLSNCYGKNGLICPSNAKLAIWLGKITQEEYEKKNKTKDEQKKLKSVKGSIKNAMSKLSSKKFIKTELNINSRKIYLLKPGDPETIYKGSSNHDPQNIRGHQMVTPGHQIMTPRSSNDDPPIINNKISNNINTDFPKKLSGQITTTMYKVPYDIRKDPKKRLETARVVKAGINVIGYEPLNNLVLELNQGSHADYAAALENGVNNFGKTN